MKRERLKLLPLPEPLDSGRPGPDDGASLEYVVMTLHNAQSTAGTRRHSLPAIGGDFWVSAAQLLVEMEES